MEPTGASMFDLHCHILPGLDGGPGTLDDALAMARLARADGIRAIIATPHLERWEGCSLPAVWREILSLSTAFSREGLDLRLLPGVEVPITEHLARDLAEGRAFPLAESRYILMTLPPGRLSTDLDAVWDDLAARDLRPIVAAPEQHPQLQRDSRPLERWVRRGVLTQLSAASLTGAAGDAAQRTAADFLRRKLAHLLATAGQDAGERAPVLSPAVAAATEIVGESAARELVTLSPLTILANGDMPYEAPLPAERRWWKVW